MELIAFYAFAGMAVAAALFVLFTRNLMYAAFALFFALTGVAALYVFAGADFLAVAQLMIYIGGILVLLVFGIMLTHSRRAPDNRSANYVEVTNSGLFRGLLVAGLFFIILAKAIYSADFILDGEFQGMRPTIKTLGLELMTSHLLPFEIVALLLLIALIGAAYLALNREKTQ